VARTQPFRDLLARAFEDGDVDEMTPLRSLEQPDAEAAPREPTRADRSPRFSAEHPFAVDMSMDRSLESFDGLNDLRALGSLDELELEDLDALSGVLVDGPAPLDEDTVHDAAIPTRPFDLHKLAEVTAGPARKRRRAPGQVRARPSPLVSRSAEAEAAPAPVRDGADLDTGALPVAVGQATSAWRMEHGNLRPVLIEPLVRPAPVELAADAPLGDGFPLEHLDAIADAATPDTSPPPDADALKRVITAIQPNHRQKNTAESFYELAVQALGKRDKKTAITHLRTAAALDPTEDRYKLMIADLADKAVPATPQLPPVKPLDQVRLPLVKGRPAR
jgi:hypothetical protein